MSEDSLQTNETAFIPRQLRPDPTFRDHGEPPLAPNSPRAELHHRAAGVLGTLLRSRLGLAHPDDAPLTSRHVCARNADVVWTAVDGEAVLLDLDGGCYFSLNAVGTVIWEMLDGTRSLAVVHEAICRRFAVEAETAWEDLVALVHRLCGAKLARLS